MLGLLFDLDGTLALTNPIHERAWRSVLAEFGVRLSQQGYAADISGRSNPEIVRRLLPQLSPAEGEALALSKEAMFRQMAPHLEVPAGLLELLERAHALGCKLSVVTNAPSANAVHVLRSLGLEHTFELIVGAEHVTAAKPDPEPYTLAATRLGLSVAECVAFEDSPSGVKAAVAAHIPVAGLLTGHPASELLAAGAQVVGDDFTAPSLVAWLERRFAALG